MEVILLENIRNLGKIGANVNVKPGYARNYLIPFNKAIVVNESNLAKFNALRDSFEKKAAEALAESQARAEKLSAIKLEITAKATDDGKLFGSVGIAAIVDAYKAHGLTLKKNEVSLPQGLIRQLGVYEVVLMLHSDVTLKVNLNVVNAK